QAPLVPAVEHRSARKDDRWDIYRGRRHQAGRRSLVTAGSEHHAVDWIAVQNFDKAKIREVAIDRGRRALTGFLAWVHRKFEGNSTCIADAVPDALGQVEMMPVAWRKVRAGLRDSDNRFSRLQFLARDAEVHIPLDIQSGHARIGGIIKPAAAAQA